MGQQIVYRPHVQRYFLDTEFMDHGDAVELLSIGLVCDDGREYYAVNAEADRTKAHPWVEKHVLMHLPPPGHPLCKQRAMIRDELLAFFQAGAKPELWAYFGAYDFVLFCQLFGRMIEMPHFLPHMCLDLKQLSLMLGSPAHPPQTGTPHHALDDARWNRRLFEHLRALP